MSESENAYDRG